MDGSKLGTAASLKPCLYDEEALRSSLSKITGSSTLTNESIYEALRESGNFASRPNGELDTRGWAFQEKILSRRIISITKEGIFWDCLRYSASDRRPLGILGDFSPGFRDVDDRRLKMMLLAPHSSGLPTTIPTTECYWHWRKAVKEYTARVLTSNRDRHIALAGVTAKFCSVLGDECVLGTWRNDALRSLLWSVDTANKGTMTASGGMIKGPSWSWVSTCKPIRYDLPLPTQHWHRMSPALTVHSEKRVEAIWDKAKVLELSVRRKNEFSFDEFDGSLVIEGASLKGFICDGRVFVRKTYVDNVQHIGDIGQVRMFTRTWIDALRHHKTTPFEKRVFLDTEFFPDASDRHDVSDPQEVICLLLAEGGFAGFSKARYFLVLEPKTKTEQTSFFSWAYFYRKAATTTYRRLGICAFDSRGICPTSVDHSSSAYDDCPCMGKTIVANIV